MELWNRNLNNLAILTQTSYFLTSCWGKKFYFMSRWEFEKKILKKLTNVYFHHIDISNFYDLFKKTNRNKVEESTSKPRKRDKHCTSHCSIIAKD